MAGIVAIFLGLIVVFGGIGGCMSYYPEYTVYQQSMEGKAAYALLIDGVFAFSKHGRRLNRLT